jgi:nucleoside-diphosphate-sugar epimerase
MRILVTGSEGSLMQAVIPELLKQGHQVVGVDKYEPVSQPEYQFLEADLVNMTDKWPFFKIDMVIHAAATIFGVGGFNAFCADILSNDLTMTRNMLRFAAMNDVKKFAFLSSSMIYERCPARESGVEEAMTAWGDFPVPFTDYGLSKYTGERMVESFHRQYNLPYVIWRPFNIITPHEMAKGVPGYAHVFADFFNAVLVKGLRTIPVIAPGTQTRCFTWIGDVAQAIAHNSEYARGVYNIGSTEEVSMLELLRRIIERSDRNPADYEVDMLQPINGDVMRRKPNIDKIGIDLGWKPKVNLDLAIDFCLSEYAKKGFK